MFCGAGKQGLNLKLYKLLTYNGSAKIAGYLVLTFWDNRHKTLFNMYVLLSGKKKLENL